MRMLSPREARALDAAAAHLASAARRYDPTAAFAPTSLVALGRIEYDLPLSTELMYWYHTQAPAHEMVVPHRNGALRMYAPTDILARQSGLRWRSLPGGGPGRLYDDWPSTWVAVGAIACAPIIAEVGVSATPVGLARRSADTWSAALLAPNLATYLEALARWLEVVVSATGARGAADVARVGGVAWRAGDGFAPEMASALARALAPVIPSEALAVWLSPETAGNGGSR